MWIILLCHVRTNMQKVLRNMYRLTLHAGDSTVTGDMTNLITLVTYKEPSATGRRDTRV